HVPRVAIVEGHGVALLEAEPAARVRGGLGEHVRRRVDTERFAPLEPLVCEPRELAGPAAEVDDACAGCGRDQRQQVEPRGQPLAAELLVASRIPRVGRHGASLARAIGNCRRTLALLGSSAWGTWSRSRRSVSGGVPARRAGSTRRVARCSPPASPPRRPRCCTGRRRNARCGCAGYANSKTRTDTPPPRSEARGGPRSAALRSPVF